MLYLIGVGLKPEHLTLEALEALKKCKKAYLESYTSKYSEGSTKELCRLMGKRVFLLNREQVEEKSEKFLALAKKDDIAFLVYGNVFSATTHMQLFLEAKKQGIKTKVIPGISIFSFLGKTGLQEYRFGRTASIPFWEKGFQPESFYDYIKENLEQKLHSLCLLDLRVKEKRFMSVKEALQLLEKIEGKRKKKFLRKARFVGLAAVGSKAEQIFFGSLKEVKAFPFKGFPQSLVVCSQLNEKELEALESFYRG